MQIRDWTPAERPLVATSWLESFFAEHASGPMLKERYEPAYEPTVDTILDAPTTRVLVAVFENEAPPLDVAGYLVVENRVHEHDKGRVRCGRPIVHYAYTIRAYREKGVAHALFDAAGIDRKGVGSFCFTFRTRDAITIVKNTWTGGRFDPLVVRFMPHPKEKTR